MNKFLKFSLYLIFFVLFAIGLGRKIEDVSENSDSQFVHDQSFGGRYKYLTSLDMVLQLVFFGLCTIDGLLELLDIETPLKSTLNFTFRSLAFPIGSFVAFSFWGIYSIDRELIFPKEFDAIIPGWHNHIMHTLPLIAVLIESSWSEHKFSKSFITGVVPTVLAGLGYLLWVLIVAKYGGFWVYPIMAVLTQFQRGLFFGGLLIVLALLYKLGDLMDGFLVVKQPALKKND
ncbi:androgen-induced protein 1 [Brachionus plicatilis]|uniref:Androgen-induced protein 1 n=1 Tax=Brachionus plicatilis TaxID=10195 RepID=A0A3M7P5U4_BRAPC|nr:androgen-induced protein 1 [Brachionus plicatilis]